MHCKLLTRWNIVSTTIQSGPRATGGHGGAVAKHRSAIINSALFSIDALALRPACFVFASWMDCLVPSSLPSFLPSLLPSFVPFIFSVVGDIESINNCHAHAPTQGPAFSRQRVNQYIGNRSDLIQKCEGKSSGGHFSPPLFCF